MVRAIIGVAIMAIGLLYFDAQRVNGVGLIFVLVGFLVFLEAPLSWSPVAALRGRSTYEKDS
jgi:membrane-bound ClpP family serine protease